MGWSPGVAVGDGAGVFGFPVNWKFSSTSGVSLAGIGGRCVNTLGLCLVLPSFETEAKILILKSLELD